MKVKIATLLSLVMLCSVGCGSPDDDTSVQAFTELGANLYMDRSGKSVRIVSLRNNTKVTDDDLVHVKGLPNLEKVFLDHTNITDAGLVHLKVAPKLQVLYLVGTKVTDEGTKVLAEMPQLRYVLMEDTAVTDEAVATLKKALPKAVVYNKSVGDMGSFLQGLQNKAGGKK